MLKRVFIANLEDVVLGKSLALDAIGRYATCSKGIRAKITGIAKMSWGFVFVGFTEGGVAWCSRSPKVEYLDSEN